MGTTAEEEHVRPFAEVLVGIDRGRSHAELSDCLHRLIQAVQDTGRPGVLTYQLKVKPASADGMVELTDQVTFKPPVFARKVSMFFVDGTGNLTSRDPRQTELELGLRDASDPGPRSTSAAKEA